MVYLPYPIVYLLPNFTHFKIVVPINKHNWIESEQVTWDTSNEIAQHYAFACHYFTSANVELVSILFFNLQYCNYYSSLTNSKIKSHFYLI